MRQGENFCLHLTTAQCLRLSERFFSLTKQHILLLVHITLHALKSNVHTETLTTSKINEEIIFCKCNGFCHLFNQFKAGFSIHLHRKVASQLTAFGTGIRNQLK